MKIFIVSVIIAILFDQLSLANVVPNEIRTKADLADKRMHASDGDISSKSGPMQLKRDGENENDFWLNIAKDFVDAQLKKKSEHE